MSNLPSIDGFRLIRILRKAGFEVVRIRGSHHFLRHVDGRATVIPAHAKETIGMVSSIRFSKIVNCPFISFSKSSNADICPHA